MAGTAMLTIVASMTVMKEAPAHTASTNQCRRDRWRGVATPAAARERCALMPGQEATCGSPRRSGSTR